MTSQPMQPPERQPIGFWTSRAGEAIRTRTRTSLQEIGITQPEWWVLHQASLHPLGMDRAEMVQTIGPNDSPAAIEMAIDSTVRKGWILTGHAGLTLSDTGTAQFERAAQLQDALQDERMKGITGEDYVTTILVLQQVIKNVGADAWHW